MTTFPNRAQLLTVLGRHLTADDAISSERLVVAEQRLGIVLAPVVVAFYRSAGAAPEFQEHDTLRAPEALDVDSEFVVFMEENQNVVAWGIPVGAATPDPLVWQRVDGEQPAWYPEEMTFSEFVVKRLAFTRGLTLHPGPSDDTGTDDSASRR